MKIIDAERLRKEVKGLERAAHKSALGCADSTTRKFHEGKDFAYQHVGILIDSLQQEQPDFPPISPDDAMKKLDEKIALVKQRGTWDGVDVDKYMDEVRGREPEKPMNQDELERELRKEIAYFAINGGSGDDTPTIGEIARHFAQWGADRQKEQDDRLVDIIYQQGIEKGKDEMRKTLKRKEKK